MPAASQAPVRSKSENPLSREHGRTLRLIIQFVIPALIGGVALVAAQVMIRPNPEKSVTVVLHGTVLDAGTHEPIADVEVDPENHTEIASQRTDMRGYFSMPVELERAAQIKDVYLVFSKSGYQRARLLITFARKDRIEDFVLTPSSAVQGMSTTESQSKRMQIASNIGFSVGGCESLGHDYKVTAPGPIDTSKPGVGGAPSGFEIQVSGNNAHGVRDIALAGSNSITFQAYADGPGTKQSLPWPINSTVCVGAQGANVAIDVYAWIK